MREERTSVDVSDGVEPVALHTGRPKLVVDVDPPAGLETDRLQSEVVGTRMPARSHRKLVDLHFCPVLELDCDFTGFVSPDGRGSCAEPHVHPAFAKGNRDLLGCERFLAPEQAIHCFDQRHLRAQRGPGLRHLGANSSSAQDRETRGHGFVRGQIAVGPRRSLAQAFDRRNPRSGASGHDHSLPGHEDVIAGAHASIAVEATALPAPALCPGSRSPGR